MRPVIDLSSVRAAAPISLATLPNAYFFKLLSAAVTVANVCAIQVAYVL